MKAQYKILSLFYDLIDVLYFNRKKYSPRTALINLIPDKPVSILDICAGTGSNSLIIAKSKPEAKITALDLSDDMLKIAAKKFRKANINNIVTVIADAGNTNFSDNSFDIILISLVLHEINEELRKSILREARRLLNNSGRVIVIEWEQPKKLFQRFMFSPIKSMEPKGFKEFLLTDLSLYLKESGFIVIEKRSCDYTQILTSIKKF